MRIDRCVCLEQTFADAVDLARRERLSLTQDVQDEFACGTGCGLCAPYVRRMLRTGTTVFHEVVTDRDEPAAG